MFKPCVYSCSEEMMQGDINKQMTQGIDDSAVVGRSSARRYCAKVNGTGAAGLTTTTSSSSTTRHCDGASTR